MDKIYNKFGALQHNVMDSLYEAEKNAFQCFLEQFPDVSLIEKRILFHEFQSSLSSSFAEYILIQATKVKRI